MRSPTPETRDRTLKLWNKALSGIWKNPLTSAKLIGCSTMRIVPSFIEPSIACTGHYILQLQMVLDGIVALDMEDAIMYLCKGFHTLTQEVNQVCTFSLQNLIAL